jgi:hypothetical protein
MEIPFIVLAIMFVAVVIGWSETWKKKEQYRHRVFELQTPPQPAPERLFSTRPLLVEWLHNNCGEYFRKRDVVALTENPNRTMNVVLGNGHTINTGLELEDLKIVLGISYSCSVKEELNARKKMYVKEN